MRRSMFLPYKRGSLSLSINAIVILVLAITMLGLGLGFTKGMFGKLSERLSVPEPDIPATAQDPISLPSDKLELQKNKEFIFSVNVYNDDFSGPVNGGLTCSGVLAGVSAESAPQEIPPGEDKMFKFIVPSQTISGTSICTIAFNDTQTPPSTESKQITISIR